MLYGEVGVTVKFLLGFASISRVPLTAGEGGGPDPWTPSQRRAWPLTWYLVARHLTLLLSARLSFSVLLVWNAYHCDLRHSGAKHWQFLPRDAMHKCGLCRHGLMPSYYGVCLSVRRCVCLSVRLSVTFVYYVKTSNRIFKLYSLSSIHTIPVFFHIKSHANIPTGTDLPNGGVKCRWCRQKSLFLTNVWLWLNGEVSSAV